MLVFNMNPSGGTELLLKNFQKYVNQDWQDSVNLILSICHPSLISNTKTNFLWQHLMTDQPNTFLMNDYNFVNNIDHFVYVSNWQLDQFKLKYPIENCNNTVIKNAIESIEYIKKPTDKIRLIYTSMPNRGLEVLVESFKILNRKDIELVVYSSNIIYGVGYNKSIGDAHDKLFHTCKTTPGIIYKGYATNKAIRKAVQQSHILAYPSIFPETSCLAAIEAGAAGCKIVTTNYGALPETCNNWATYVDYSTNFNKLAYDYAEVLNHEIDNYQDTCYNQQSEWFNSHYSWENRKHQWNDFLQGII